MTYYIISTLALLLLKKFLNSLSPEQTTINENQVKETPALNHMKTKAVIDLETKRKYVMDNLENYATFSDFAEYWSKAQGVPHSKIMSVTQDIRGKFNVLLDLKNTQDIYFQSNQLLILNVDVLIFAIKRNTPIYIEEEERLVS